ncbi:MAG: PAS domain S-box protein [Reyranella sp.]|uniref:PAS domain S-box protein n=1 Tax=Reyranella sp. TaxID=1929291 RepID=UPI00272F1601|nr:PAS domain S-box protein [Reyranella sp.]MDP1963627.1 PAS domain S-box protein [Reyranella sp.]MDP2372852.1 PAS domain S-box protein [Reyranella sp.]
MTDKFSLLAGIASDWWWEMDADLRFTYFSDRFSEIFGLPASVALGKTRTEIGRTDYDNPAWRAHLEVIANHLPYRGFETTFVDADGVSRPVSISGTPLFAADGTFEGYIGVGHDLTELRRREREAAEQAATLNSILENIDQGVVLFDKELKIAAYNRRLGEWLQVDGSRDARGESYERIVRDLADRGEYAPEHKETAIATRLRLVRSRERFVGERRRGDGRIVAVTFNPLPEGGGVMTYSDVTEARMHAARLAESEENFRYLFRNSPLPMWVYQTETLKFLEVNDVALSKYGYTRDEFLAMTLKDVRPAEDVERLEQWMQKPPTDRLHAGEWRHRTKGGRIFDVQVFLRDIEFGGEAARLALVADITARKEAERQTERIFETSLDLMLVTDGFGNVLRVSPSSIRVLGFRPDEMVGRSATDFICPEDLEATRNEMRAARRGNASRNFRSRYVHKDGHLVSLVWMGVWSESDRHYFFVGRDMTEYDRTEGQLRQAQKMEMMGQLTGGVAHDFNNILMVILANVDALEEDEELAPALRDRIEDIAKATERAADLTRQLLAFSRKQALQPRRTDVNLLVVTTGKLLQRTLGEQIEIDFSLADDLWSAAIDRAQLESALVNLSLNARDAMPDGGRLLIETANKTLDEDYVAHNADTVAGDYVMLAVSDTGMGIAPDILDKVFEPFFTTKEIGKGTGLGLSMVYGFIKQSNGHIKIYSEPGRGTSIRLYLPRTGADAPAETAPGYAPPPGGSERILAVEDDPKVRAIVAGQLRSLGYTVAEASDGPMALAALEAAPQPFDLLLTDVIMPGPMNGKALADEILRRRPKTRVVFMSGYTEDAVVHHGRLDAGVLLLSKPFRKIDLAQILRQALDGVAREA